MDTQVVQAEETQGEVMEYIFPMAMRPVDVQLTIHVNNLIETYGNQVTKEFKDALNIPDHIVDLNSYHGLVVKQLINYYGPKVVRNWFTLVYNWKFEKAG